MNLSNSKKISFSGLNEIRAIAALAVVFHHLELFKKREGLVSIFDIKLFTNLISKLGHNGVILFFTLSGFLITFLLLNEKKQFGFIDIKAFYIRRILRIWPLYFIIIIGIGFLLLPLIGDSYFFSNQNYYPHLIKNINYWSLILFILFLSNFALIFHKPIAGAAQSWSVSVEEQFYLIWPQIVNKISKIKTLFLFILILPFVKYLAEITIAHYWNYKIVQILHRFSIEYMCFGALFAILLFTDKIPNIIFKQSKIILAVTILCILILLFFFDYRMVLAVFFGILILLVAKSNYKNNAFFYLGKISYGIYMYHPLCMFICFSLAKYITTDITYFNIIYYVSTLLLTITISHFSFYYIESKFLNLKHKFTKIDSGA